MTTTKSKGANLASTDSTTDSTDKTETVDKDLDSTSSNESNTSDPFEKPAEELDTDTVVDPHGDRVAIPGTVAEPVRTAPLTFTDNRGVERLVGGFDDGWEPAQVDPDPLLVAHNEARQAELDQAAKDLEKRQESLKTDAERESEKGA
jgi:hypothetical protein